MKAKKIRNRIPIALRMRMTVWRDSPREGVCAGVTVVVVMARGLLYAVRSLVMRRWISVKMKMMANSRIAVAAARPISEFLKPF